MNANKLQTTNYNIITLVNFILTKQTKSSIITQLYLYTVYITYKKVERTKQAWKRKH